MISPWSIASRPSDIYDDLARTIAGGTQSINSLKFQGKKNQSSSEFNFQPTTNLIAANVGRSLGFLSQA